MRLANVRLLSQIVGPSGSEKRDQGALNGNSQYLLSLKLVYSIQLPPIPSSSQNYSAIVYLSITAHKYVHEWEIQENQSPKDTMYI